MKAFTDCLCLISLLCLENHHLWLGWSNASRACSSAGSVQDRRAGCGFCLCVARAVQNIKMFFALNALNPSEGKKAVSVCLQHYLIISIGDCPLTNWGKTVSSPFWKVSPLKRMSDCEAERVALMGTICYDKSFTWDKILISIIEKWPHCFISSVNVSCHSVFIASVVKVYEVPQRDALESGT